MSQETDGIIAFVKAAGIPYRVTDTTGPGHAPNSYHYAQGTGGEGLAVDFGGVAPGVTPETSAEMAAVYRALLNTSASLAELIHNAPGITVAVKDGRRVDGPTVYAGVWEDHRNHVHVAVPRGIILTPLSHPAPTIGGNVPDDPNIPNSQASVVAAWGTPSGKGYTIVTADGAVFCFGDAEYHGRIEAPAS